MKTVDQINSESTKSFLQEVQTVTEDIIPLAEEPVVEIGEVKTPIVTTKALSDMNREELITYLLRLIVQMILQGKLDINNF